MAYRSNNTHVNAVNNQTYCQPYAGMTSGGFLFGKDFKTSPLPLLLMQLSTVNIVSMILQILLKPFGQFSYVAQILSGIVLGPSCLSRIEKIRELIFLPQMGNVMVNAFENIGLMIVFFLLSVQIDLSVLKRPGKLAFTIGITMLILPFAINIPLASFLKRFVSNEELRSTLPAVAALGSTSNFQQTLVFLQDLKILNSELGRIALTSTVIAGLGCFVFASIGLQVVELKNSVQAMAFICIQLSQIFMIVIIIFALRPTLIWMIKHTPERKPLKESYICVILMMILGCALFGEFTGQHPMNGPIMLGMATPDSPPMGSSLAHKVGCFAWYVFMPGYTLNVGKRINVSKIGFENAFFVGLTAAVGTLVKFFCIMIPSLYYKMTLKDALPLCLIMTCRGIFDILTFYRAKQFQLIDEESFATMVLASLFHSIIIAPVVRGIYDHSRRYLTHTKRTIENSKRHCELRIVACIHEQDNVLPMINLLEISNPTTESPLAVYVLYLEELVGRTMPLFISHQYEREESDKPTESSRIINAFQKYGKQRLDAVVTQCFTSLAPYSSMHNDICSLGHEKCSALVIVPYQKSDSPYIRTVNKNVLYNAPCSVAIFFGRGVLLTPNFWKSESVINVCVIFLGGPDDREALAYSVRMEGHPLVRLTVIRFIDEDHTTTNLLERQQDEYAINNFRIALYENKSVEYMEENLAGAHETAKMLRFIEKDFDLVLVGRRHDNDLPILKGLSEWSEIQEFGVIADMLVSLEGQSRASVLVVQQQASDLDPFESALSSSKKINRFDRII